MLRAKFIGGLKLRATEKICLNTVISMNNHNQMEEAFFAFVELVNKNKNQISTLNIILSGELFRHYVNKTVALSMSKDWLEKNSKYLDFIEVKYNIFQWEEFISCEKFKYFFTSVQSLYETDEIFSKLLRALQKDMLTYMVK